MNVQQLIAALRPFADAANACGEHQSDESRLDHPFYEPDDVVMWLTVGELRRAREVLKALEDEGYAEFGGHLWTDKEGGGPT